MFVLKSASGVPLKDLGFWNNMKREITAMNATKNFTKCNEYKRRMEALKDVWKNHVAGNDSYKGSEWVAKFNKYDMDLHDKYHKRGCPLLYERVGRGQQRIAEYRENEENLKHKGDDDTGTPKILRTSVMDLHEGGRSRRWKSSRGRYTRNRYTTKRKITRKRKRKSFSKRRKMSRRRSKRSKH